MFSRQVGHLSPALLTCLCCQEAPGDSSPHTSRPKHREWERKIVLMRLRPLFGAVRSLWQVPSMFAAPWLPCLGSPPLAAAPEPLGWAGAGIAQADPADEGEANGVLLVKGRGNRGLLWQHQQPPLVPVCPLLCSETSGRFRGRARVPVAVEGNMIPALPAPAAGAGDPG